MAGAGAGVAAHQDVPLQADHRGQHAGPRQPPPTRGGCQRTDETLSRAAASQMDKLPIGEGIKNVVNDQNQEINLLIIIKDESTEKGRSYVHKNVWYTLVDFTP